VHLFLLPILPIEKRFTYDAEFKRKVILCAEQFGTHAAVRMLRMSETIVRRRRGTKTNLFSCKESTVSYCDPRGARRPELDAATLTYFRES
jgi:hypothetical protein